MFITVDTLHVRFCLTLSVEMAIWKGQFLIITKLPHTLIPNIDLKVFSKQVCFYRSRWF